MEDHEKLIKSLLERATEYGQTVYELIKFRILDKSIEVVSSLITRYVLLIIVLLFMVFAGLGLGLWLGEILGKTYYGLFIVAAFYFIFVIVLQFFLRKRFKKMVSDYIIKHELNLKN
jgi:hypothetical protein